MTVDEVRADIENAHLLDPRGDKEWGWYLEHVPVLLAEIDRLERRVGEYAAAYMALIR